MVKNITQLSELSLNLETSEWFHHVCVRRDIYIYTIQWNLVKVNSGNHPINFNQHFRAAAGDILELFTLMLVH